MSNEKAHQGEALYFNINQVARQIGVVPATIRNWEREGLFTAKRGSNNYRIFSFEDIEHLKRINEYSSEGMTINLISKMLSTDHTARGSSAGAEADGKDKYDKLAYTSKLRETREAQGYTLREVSEAVGISPSHLSRIEHGKGNASLSVINSLASFYGESMIYFFDSGRQPEALVRNGEGTKIATHLTGVEITSLITESTLSAGVVKFTARPGCGDFLPHSHKHGHEIIYLLAGALTVTVNGSDEYEMQAGDCLSFTATADHKWKNSGHTAVEFLWFHSYL